MSPLNWIRSCLCIPAVFLSWITSLNCSASLSDSAVSPAAWPLGSSHYSRLCLESQSSPRPSPALTTEPVKPHSQTHANPEPNQSTPEPGRTRPRGKRKRHQSTGWACTLLQVCNTFLSRKKCLWMIRKTRQHPSSWSKKLNIMKQYVSTLTVKQSEVEAKYTYLITVLQLHILVFTRVFILVPPLNANISMSSLLIFPTRLITLVLRHRRGVFIFPSKHCKWLAGGTKTQKMILLEHPSLLFILKQSAEYTEYF